LSSYIEVSLNTNIRLGWSGVRAAALTPLRPNRT